ncbi:hypothetical protein D3C85_1392670 [compost metagenome]
MPGLHHPTLQLHQLTLQAEQLAEVTATFLPFRALAEMIIEQCFEVVIVLQQLQLQFFVAVIEQFAVDALHQGVVGQQHGQNSRRSWKCPC